MPPALGAPAGCRTLAFGVTRTRIVLLVVLALVIATVCIRLGFWQLERLAERRAENARVAAGLAGAPIPIEAVSADSSQSRAQRVEVRGTFDYAHEITLINRSRDGAPGVNILTPLRIPGRDTAVIINRGWVYSPDGAAVDLARWREPVNARGTAYVSWLGTQATGDSALAGASVRVAPGSEGTAGTPGGAGAGDGNAAERDTVTRRVARLQRESIARLLPYPIAPYQLILIDESSANAAGAPGYGGASPAPFGTAVVDPTRPVRIPLPALDEGPHRSYALQWFAFAAIALIGTAAVVRGERASRTRAPL